jgi:hypothetical protein
MKENLSLSLYSKKSSTIGLLPSGALVAPDDIIEQNKQLREWCNGKKVYLSLYSKHFPTIASGATPIGSTGHAPDKILVSKNNKEGKRKLVYWCYSHREGIHISQPEDFQYLNSQTRRKRLQDMIPELCHHDKTRMPWLKQIVKVRPPGSILCGLVYALGCALLVTFCVYNAKKILVDALGTLRTTRTLSL